MPVLRKIFFCSCFLWLNSFSFSQSTVNPALEIKDTAHPSYSTALHLYIQNIIIKGNKTTKDYVILREAQLSVGDSILTADLYTQIEQSRQNIYNTTLFNEVTIHIIAIDAFNINLEINVRERWYIFPAPQFKLVDRSFNEWIKTHNADLRRVVYGVKFAHFNVSGRRDQLKVFLLNGYRRGLSFSYASPYSNRKLTQGFSISAGYAVAREINYATNKGDSLVFFSTKSQKDSTLNSFISKTFSTAATFRIRKGVFNTHIFGLGYTYVNVIDSIPLKYNPNYFGNGESSVGFFDFSYTYSHIKVNHIAYPLKGKVGYFGVLKRGLGFSGGINMLSLEAGYTRFLDLGKNWYFTNSSFSNVKLPFKQAYINQRGLGFGNAFLRGLELYAIDGVAFAINKATLRKKIASFSIRLPFGIPVILKKNESIPFTFYAKTYTDVGYSYNKFSDSYLNRRLLYTGGFGIDMLTFYDLIVRFEYSFNQLNEKGLFLRLQSGF